MNPKEVRGICELATVHFRICSQIRALISDSCLLIWFRETWYASYRQFPGSFFELAERKYRLCRCYSSFITRGHNKDERKEKKWKKSDICSGRFASWRGPGSHSRRLARSSTIRWMIDFLVTTYTSIWLTFSSVMTDAIALCLMISLVIYATVQCSE